MPNSSSSGTGLLLADAEKRLSRLIIGAARPQALIQDSIDCAELAFSAGHHDIAAILYGTVFLQTGVSSHTLAMLGRGAAAANLWPDWPTQELDSRRGLSIDLAVEELRALMRLKSTLANEESDPSAFLPPDVSIGVQPDTNPSFAISTMGQNASAILRGLGDQAPAGAIAETLRSGAREISSLPPVRLDEHVDLSLTELVDLFAFQRLREFAVTNAYLVSAGSGSGDLFAEAGCLPPGGLGPYFSNVGKLLRNARDLFGLIDVAAEGRTDARLIETWCILLSAHLPGDALRDLVSELADRGMTRALQSILIHVARKDPASAPHDVARGVRDGGLDLGDFALAELAQHLLALWRITDSVEWRLLGEIRALQGDWPGATAAIERALRLRPADAVTLASLAAVQARRTVAPANIDMARQRLRQARLKAFHATSQAA